MNALHVAERSAVYALRAEVAPIADDAFDLMAKASRGAASLREHVVLLASRGLLSRETGSTAPTSLGAVAEFVMGQAPPGTACNKNGEGTIFVKTGEFGNTYPEVLEWTTQPLKLAQQGDVLICVVGATIGKLNLAIDCAIGRSVAAVRPGPKLETKYLYYALMPFTLSLRRGSRGSAQGVIGKSELSRLPIRVPPIPEQHRIVARVEELMGLCDDLEAHGRLQDEQHARLVVTLFDALVASASPKELAENWQRVANHLDLLLDRPEAVDALEQTILQLAVRGLLVPQDSADEPARALIRRMGERDGTRNSHKEVGDGLGRGDNSAAPMLPKGWTWATIDSIASVGTGTTPSRTNPAYFSPASIPWVTSGETSQSFIARTEQGVSPLALRDTSLKVYPVGTLIVAMYGQGKTRGQISELQIEATTNQACAAIVPATVDVGHRRYLKLFFEKIYDEIRELSAGGAQPNLNVGKIKATLVPLPPLAEQRRIVARVEELRAICADLRKHLQQARATQSHFADALVARAVA